MPRQDDEEGAEATTFASTGNSKRIRERCGRCSAIAAVVAKSFDANTRSNRTPSISVALHGNSSLKSMVTTTSLLKLDRKIKFVTSCLGEQGSHEVLRIAGYKV